jgi:hypothetical protein
MFSARSGPSRRPLPKLRAFVTPSALGGSPWTQRSQDPSPETAQRGVPDPAKLIALARAAQGMEWPVQMMLLVLPVALSDLTRWRASLRQAWMTVL